MAKRQKLCDKSRSQNIDKLIEHVNECKDTMWRLSQEGGWKASEPKSALAKLKKGVKSAMVLKKVNSSHKQLHARISKFGKVIDKAVPEEEALRNPGPSPLDPGPCRPPQLPPRAPTRSDAAPGRPSAPCPPPQSC